MKTQVERKWKKEREKKKKKEKKRTEYKGKKKENGWKGSLSVLIESGPLAGAGR